MSRNPNLESCCDIPVTLIDANMAYNVCGCAHVVQALEHAQPVQCPFYFVLSKFRRHLEMEPLLCKIITHTD